MGSLGLNAKFVYLGKQLHIDVSQFPHLRSRDKSTFLSVVRIHWVNMCKMLEQCHIVSTM